MITKKFGIDFFSEGGALTLNSKEVTEPYSSNTIHHKRKYTKTHKSGWTITAIVKEDYYEWVNEFEAIHNLYGIVKGDFEHEVYADSEEGFRHFYKHHTPHAWDYGNI